MDRKEKMLALGGALGLGLGLVLSRKYLESTKDQSLSSKAFNNILASLDIKEKTELMLVEDYRKAIENQVLENRRLVANPLKAILKDPEDFLIHGMQVFTWNGKEDKDQDLIIYFPGGGYVFHPELYQYIFADIIASKSGYKMLMPIYPKAPEFNYKEAFRSLEPLYREVLEKRNPATRIHFLGDSAGAGLALGFYYYIFDNKIDLPDSMCLVCPWLNLANDNPLINEALENEIFFGIRGLNLSARAWAGSEKDRKNPYVSPFYGDPKKIKTRLLIFTGTNEVFHPDIMSFSSRLDKLGVGHQLVVGRGEHHNYPAYPTVEGRRARRRIVKFMKGKNS